MENEKVVVVESKKWYKSDTLRANAVVIAIMVLQVATGNQLLEPDIQALLVALLNILLRFKTNAPIA